MNVLDCECVYVFMRVLFTAFEYARDRLHFSIIYIYVFFNTTYNIKYDIAHVEFAYDQAYV